ncbi:type-F conjugative transfer system pilin assembly protein TrbC [Sphingomonas solaris]|uniref:Type-F conjugative transfer system pilin assembly protein TrbC n=1 Tax=Alterirhizorhabdus solaris TaxID=2529389 RepID=A0A558RBY8_9SPHN|nr:type-F conjugative transfer system pilin assembly protein TrbC [Sphingomonas solaris]TVV76929.1 type-F conjugative transfer system pilin assembly protein TrbC [Sphingomonas solaris]
MRRTTIVIAALAGVAGIQALAQTVDGLDLQAIKRRSAEMATDAQAFAEQVRTRGDAFREDAIAVRDKGTDNIVALAKADLPAGSDGAFDFDEIIKGASGNVAGTKGDAPQFIAFASLSMPPASLRQLIAETSKAGGIVVFRGFPNNSMKQFSAMLGKVVNDKDQLSNVGIDPRLFRAFDVQAVPTYVAVSSDFDMCAGLHCKTVVPPYDRITGNVSVRYVLDTFVDARGPGAGVAAVARRNMAKAGG